MYDRLSGDVQTREVTAPTKKASSAGWLLVLALLCVAGFAVTHYAPSFYESKSQTVAASRPALTVSLGDAEDLQRHLNNASAAYKEAASATARSRDWADRALSSLDDIPMTARRLQLARSASQTAQAQINRAHEELEIAKAILNERSSKQ